LNLLDSLYVQQGISWVDGVMCNPILLFNTQGDTLRSTKLFSPIPEIYQDGDDYMAPIYSVLMPDTSIYVSTIVVSPDNLNDACIWKLNPTGEVEWYYLYSTPAEIETVYSGICLSVAEGITQWAMYLTQEAGEGDSDLILLTFNADGQLLDETSIGSLPNAAKVVYAMTIDNEFWYMTGANQIDPELGGMMALWKMNSEDEVLWTTTFGEQRENFFEALSAIVQTTDGHLVSIGSHLFYEENEDFTSVLKVVKVNKDNGSVIWDRNYHIVESMFDIHRAFDLKPTPDGGVIFCGEATDLDSNGETFEAPSQRGWLVKLDACGCLVPGCDEMCIVSTAELDELTPQFIFGPNPFNDVLNIYLKPQADAVSSTSTIEIFDLSGRLVESFPSPRGETTYMVSLNALASGEYLICLKQEGRVVQTGKVVKE
jgi:hypothetical protein